MGRQITVIGGWAFSPCVLKLIYGDSAVYVDINPILPKLMKDDHLVPDWQAVSLELLAPLLPENPTLIVGWSTGAFFTYLLAQNGIGKAFHFLGATPSFCRRDDFTFGMPNILVSKMRKGLATNMDQTLKDFYRQCGIDGTPNTPEDYTPEMLYAGLAFLEQASLLPLKSIPQSATFYHGRNDRIVPLKAGEFFASQTNAKLEVFDGHHAFFINGFELDDNLLELKKKEVTI